MNTQVYRTTPSRCVDCGNVISVGDVALSQQGPRCVPCTRAFEESDPEPACENCGKPLVGRELRWAEDVNSPYCWRCAGADEGAR